MKKEPAPAKPEAKGGHACKGKLRKEFAEAKANPKLHGDISVLVSAMRSGDSEEKRETAKIVVLEKLGSAVDYSRAISEFIEAGYGEPAVKGVLTKHFSELLKTSRGLERIGTLADIKDEGVLKELIKSVADTRDPATLDFIIRASRSVSHPVGAWQAPKVANAGNVDRVMEFVRSEAARQPDELRERILKSAEGNGLAGISVDVKQFPVSEPASAPKPGAANPMVSGPVYSQEQFNGRSGEALDAPLAEPHTREMKMGPDLSLFVQTREAFYKTHGFASIVQAVQGQVNIYFSPYREEKRHPDEYKDFTEDRQDGGAGAAFRMTVPPAAGKAPYQTVAERMDHVNATMEPQVPHGRKPFRDKVLFFKEMALAVIENNAGIQEAQPPAVVPLKEKRKKTTRKETQTHKTIKTVRGKSRLSVKMPGRKAGPGSRNAEPGPQKKTSAGDKRRRKPEKMRENATARVRPRSLKSPSAGIRAALAGKEKNKKERKRENERKAAQQENKRGAMRRKAGKETVPGGTKLPGPAIGREKEKTPKSKSSGWMKLPKGRKPENKDKPAKIGKAGTAPERRIAGRKTLRMPEKKTGAGEARKTKSKRIALMLLMEKRKRKSKTRR